jgi:integrase
VTTADLCGTVRTMIYKRDESKFYWVRLEKAGRVIQRSTRSALLREAKDFEAKLRLEEFGPEGPGTFATTLKEFWPELEAYWKQNCKGRTLKYYKESLRPVLDFPKIADCQLHHIKQPLVEKFFTHRLAQDLSVTTVNHSIRALRRALHVASDKFGYINRAPKLTLLTGENKREAVVSESDFQRILKACGLKTTHSEHKGWHEVSEPTVACETMRALFTLMFDGGLRAGEACKMEWKNVNFEKRSVFIESGKTKAARRRVPLTVRIITALKALRALCPDAQYCFTRRRPEGIDSWRGDRPLTVGWVSHKFMRLRRALKLPDGVVLHSLRHSCATRYGNTGQCNVLDLMAVMGWESAEIAKRYVHLDDTRLAAMSKLLEPHAR